VSFADELLPAVNACLNGTSAILLFSGWRAIKARRVETHWRLMVAAVTASALFLVFYVIRFSLTGAHRYPAPDWTRTVYYVVLSSHSLLAVVVLPLVARTLFLGARKRFAQHKKLARWTFPIWAYVSVTGVIVYFMLYHLGPSRVP
jgi:putative membrane protein